MPLGEFAFIDRYLKPLAAQGGLGLADDAAVLAVPAGHELVIAKDAMVENVHFLTDDPPGTVARKLLRVNLSDLAAMGARPLGYLTAFAFPRRLDEAWYTAFAAGFAADQAEYGIGMLGGDTVSTPGPLTLSLTILGTVPTGKALRRNGAKPGDDVYVSGTLGDGALGLRVIRDAHGLNPKDAAWLAERYRLPQPRLALGEGLLGLAHAAMDVSDGLLADLQHILDESRVGAEIEQDLVPLSEAGRCMPGALEAALTGGDDYELLFTAAPEAVAEIAALADRIGIKLTRIGRILTGRGLAVRAVDGTITTPQARGWTHF